MGESGSGKSAVAEALEKKYRLKQIRTYTTRKHRYPGEDTHTFTDDQHFLKDLQANNIIARTTYCDNQYWTTIQQIETNDVTIFDTCGCKEFLEKNQSLKNAIIIYLKAPVINRIKNMRKRGDSWKAIFKRIKYDYGAFNDVKEVSDKIIINDGKKSINKLSEIIYRIYKFENRG